MNNVVLSGRLVKDPDVHYLKGDNSNAVLRYTMAVTRDFKNADGKYDTDFISCVAWDRNAEFISKHFKKGSPITIVGNIRTGNYTNKEGQKVYTTDVFTDKIEFVAGAKNENSNETNTQQSSKSYTKKSNASFMYVPETDDDEMPFS